MSCDRGVRKGSLKEAPEERSTGVFVKNREEKSRGTVVQHNKLTFLLGAGQQGVQHKQDSRLSSQEFEVRGLDILQLHPSCLPCCSAAGKNLDCTPMLLHLRSCRSGAVL